jgi:hypothetical protein
MKRTVAERNIVVFLFITVLVIFSMAERDSRKLTRLYTVVLKGGAKQALVETHPAPVRDK